MIVDKSLEGKRIKLVNTEKLCQLNFCAGISPAFAKQLSDVTIMRVDAPTANGFWFVGIHTPDLEKAKYNEEDDSWDIEILLTNTEVECFGIIEG